MPGRQRGPCPLAAPGYAVLLPFLSRQLAHDPRYHFPVTAGWDSLAVCVELGVQVQSGMRELLSSVKVGDPSPGGLLALAWSPAQPCVPTHFLCSWLQCCLGISSQSSQQGWQRAVPLLVGWTVG